MVTTLLVPTFALAKVAVGVPVTLKLSPFTSPLKLGVPVVLAVVVRSYSLFTPERPVIVSALGATVLEPIATFWVVAPPPLTVTLPEYVPAAVVAANRT